MRIVQHRHRDRLGGLARREGERAARGRVVLAGPGGAVGRRIVHRHGPPGGLVQRHRERQRRAVCLGRTGVGRRQPGQRRQMGLQPAQAAVVHLRPRLPAGCRRVPEEEPRHDRTADPREGAGLGAARMARLVGDTGTVERLHAVLVPGRCRGIGRVVVDHKPGRRLLARHLRRSRQRQRVGVHDRPRRLAVGDADADTVREDEPERLLALVIVIVQHRHRDRLHRLARAEGERAARRGCSPRPPWPCRPPSRSPP